MAKYQVDTEDGHSYQVETEDPPTAPVAPNALEEKISPTGGDDNFVTSPHGLIRTGARQAVHGIREMFSPGNRMQGASDVIRGVGRAALPAALPVMAANPATAALGLGAGALGGGAAKLGLGAIGASEGAQNLGEDVAGIALGGVGLKGAPPGLDSAVGAGMKVAAPKVVGGGLMIGAGEGLAHVPGMEWPARIGLGYPGARAIGTGLKEGYGATKDVLAFSRAAENAKNLPSGPSPKWQGPNIPPVTPPESSVPKPTLPSGRVPGGIQNQNVPPVQVPVQSPQAAAAKDTHMPGVTQVQEFQPPKVQPPITPQGPPPTPPTSNLQPQGGHVSPGGVGTESATQVMKPGTQPPGEGALTASKPFTPNEVPQGVPNLKAIIQKNTQEQTNVPKVENPYIERASVQKHLAAIPGRDANTLAYHEATKTPVAALEELRDNAEQAEDPAKQFAAQQELKVMGRKVYSWAKANGKSVPNDPYKAISLDGLNATIEKMKSKAP